MKKTIRLFFLVLACVLCAALPIACADGGQAARLEANGWSAATRARIDAVMEEYGKYGERYDESNPPYAVFDFDNTTVVNDVEEALLIYQLENLRFSVAPESFESVLKTGIPDVNAPFDSEYDNADGERVNVASIASDCAECYAYLYENYEGMEGDKTLEEVKATDFYKAFVAKMRYLYEAINGTFDASVGYPWVTYLFTGMTGAEVRALAAESHDYWLAYGEFNKVTLDTPASFPQSAGLVSVSYKTGLAFPAEMKDLYAKLRENGFVVYVCSASFVDVVTAAACDEKYGYGVSEDNVYAMRLKTDENGRYINEFDDEYFQTQGEGKVRTIDRFIRPAHNGSEPILVAGDSAGDYAMLSSYENMKLGLIINRFRDDSVKELCNLAAAAIGKPDAKYVLQGRDENAGAFRPSEKSVLLGESVEKLVRSELKPA